VLCLVVWSGLCSYSLGFIFILTSVTDQNDLTHGNSVFGIRVYADENVVQHKNGKSHQEL
jgi:hypothetical protein